MRPMSFPALALAPPPAHALPPKCIFDAFTSRHSALTGAVPQTPIIKAGNTRVRMPSFCDDASNLPATAFGSDSFMYQHGLSLLACICLCLSQSRSHSCKCLSLCVFQCVGHERVPALQQSHGLHCARSIASVRPSHLAFALPILAPRKLFLLLLDSCFLLHGVSFLSNQIMPANT